MKNKTSVQLDAERTKKLETNRLYREKNKEELKIKNRERYLLLSREEKDVINSRVKAYYHANPERAKAYSNEYYKKHRERDREKRKAYAVKRRAEKGEQDKAWREANKEQISKKNREWREANKKLNVKKKKAYFKDICTNLKDTYVNARLKTKYGNDMDYPSELIEAERLFIQIDRTIKVKNKNQKIKDKKLRQIFRETDTPEAVRLRRKAYSDKYKADNRESIREKAKIYRTKNSIVLKAKSAIRRDKNREADKATAKARRLEIKLGDPEVYEAMLVKHRAHNKRSNEAHPEKVKERQAKKTKEQIRGYYLKSYYKDHEASLAKAKERALKHIQNLSPCYVNSLLRNRGIDPKKCPKGTIEAFKTQLLIKRELGIKR